MNNILYSKFNKEKIKTGLSNATATIAYDLVIAEFELSGITA